jgi:pimeloyl-ACP methyl ester carboxylesterase
LALVGFVPGTIRYGSIAVSSSDSVGYGLYTPTGVDPRSITRVAYVLPGRDDRAKDALTLSGYADESEARIRAGSPPFALLAIDSDASYYHPRMSGRDRLAVVEHRLPKLARTLLAPHLTAESLIGQSMGGYGALLVAERSPQRYRSVAVAAPALFQSFHEEEHAIGDGFDNAREFATYDVIAHAARLARVPVMVRVGYNDPFLANVKAFARAAPFADVGYIENGCHDAGFWRATASELIAFTASHLGTQR